MLRLLPVRRNPSIIYKNGLFVFWHLPYEMRRNIFRLLCPRTYSYWQGLRKSDGAKTDDYSLAPMDNCHCIFVHIPKCAGLSIATTLFGNRAGGHITILDYQLIFSASEFDSYFKFAFVRNPWDRLVSAFSFLKMGGLTDRDRIWGQKNLSSYGNFKSFVEGWVNDRNIYLYPHFVPQFQFLLDPTTKKLGVDFIGNYEMLEQDFKKICERLGISSPLSEQNKSPRRYQVYREYYNEQTRDIVAKVYQDDIRLFGYVF